MIMENKTYAVYLTETSNTALNELLDSGESVEGMLEIGETEVTFTALDRLVFQYNTFLAEDDTFLFKNGTEYYKFSHKPLETVKAVS